MKQQKQTYSNILLYIVLAIVVVAVVVAALFGSNAGQAIRTPYDGCLNLAQQKTDLADAKNLASKIVDDARSSRDVPRPFLSTFNKEAQELIDSLNFRFDSPTPSRSQLVERFQTFVSNTAAAKQALASMNSGNALVQKEMQALGVQLDLVNENARDAMQCVSK